MASVLSVAVLGGELVIVPDAPRWRGGILFDDAARGGLRLESPGDRAAARTLSDILGAALVAHPFLVDAGLAAWAIGGNRDVAAQMLGVDFLSMASTAFVLHFTKNLVARERPYAQGCEDEPIEVVGCDSRDRFRSFFSGHTAYAFTGASLICVHHANLPLFGGGAADAAACIGAAALASTVALLRVLSDRHFLTDVLVGALVGAASGLLIPSLLHYGASWSQADGTAPPPP